MPTTTDDPSAPLIIVNPRASRLDDQATRQAVVEGVVRAVRARTGLPPRVEDGSLEAAQAALAAMADPPLVVAVGGDGTIRQAAVALAGRPIPLAIVPGGTGNVLAGTLGIRGVGTAEDTIRHGVPQTVDLGTAAWGTAGSTEADGRSVFLVACGMGLDARIMAAAEHAWKRRLRFGAYVGATLRELTRLSPADFSIVADGERLRLRGYLALVANAGEIVPGRIGPRERIDPTDGRLDLLVLGGGHPIAGLRGAAELLFRSGEVQGAIIRRSVSAVRIEADQVQPIQTDGDPHPPGWLEASVLPGALTLLTRGG
jgi:diacylglycerol kinase (ATP)